MGSDGSRRHARGSEWENQGTELEASGKEITNSVRVGVGRRGEGHKTRDVRTPTKSGREEGIDG